MTKLALLLALVGLLIFAGCEKGKYDDNTHIRILDTGVKGQILSYDSVNKRYRVAIHDNDGDVEKVYKFDFEIEPWDKPTPEPAAPTVPAPTVPASAVAAHMASVVAGCWNCEVPKPPLCSQCQKALTGVQPPPKKWSTTPSFRREEQERKERKSGIDLQGR